VTRRCVAPLEGSAELCGEDASESRLVEGLDCPLCAEHAAELDRDYAGEEPAEETMMKTITIDLGSDFGCEITEHERDAYATLVLAELSASYPDHEVEVTHGALDQRVYAEVLGEGPENFDGEVEAEIAVESTDLEREVEGVIQDVWSMGQFWSED